MNVTDIKVFNIQSALEGMRNPLESWAKGDTKDGIIGPKDMVLAKSLIKGGTEHRKFLRQIFVSMYIQAPMYWFAELDTYKIGTTRNSTSFMHTGLKQPFVLGDFAHSKDNEYWLNNISYLNKLREEYNNTKSPEVFEELRSILPSGFIYGSTLTMNYENVLNMINQRKNHKLSEWRELCKILMDLPYIKDFYS